MKTRVNLDRDEYICSCSDADYQRLSKTVSERPKKQTYVFLYRTCATTCTILLYTVIYRDRCDTIESKKGSTSSSTVDSVTLRNYRVNFGRARYRDVQGAFKRIPNELLMCNDWWLYVFDLDMQQLNIDMWKKYEVEVNQPSMSEGRRLNIVKCCLGYQSM